MLTLGYVIFYVADVARAVDFYERAFGMTPRFVSPENDYGELDTGSTTLAFAATTLAHANLADAGGFTELDPTNPPPGASITLLTTDVAAALATAIAAGATPYTDPVDKPWGQTVAYVRDLDGVLVELATPVAG
jgi:lactoylglutathione lyase